jgi:hypothetical protein
MLTLVNPVIAALSPRSRRALAAVSDDVFASQPAVYPARAAVTSVAPPGLVHHSERTAVMEQLDYNLLFRWFVGLNTDEAFWAPTVLTKNCDRLEQGNIAEAFL